MIDETQAREARDFTPKPELKVGGRTCQCGDCGLFFTGLQPFDRHLKNRGTAHVTCRTEKEMQAIGMLPNKHGTWQYGQSLKERQSA